MRILLQNITWDCCGLDRAEAQKVRRKRQMEVVIPDATPQAQIIYEALAVAEDDAVKRMGWSQKWAFAVGGHVTVLES